MDNLDKLMRYLFLRGNNVVNGSTRIRKIVKDYTPENVKVQKLKDEYGIGGGTLNIPGYRSISYDGKGVKVTKENGEDVKFTWKDMLKIYKESIDNLMDIEEVDGYFIYTMTGEIVSPKFDYHKCPEDYIKEGVEWIEPMTAKEEQNEEKLEEMLEPDSGYIAEEKFDGTRGIIYFSSKGNRVFSRTVSKKTGWFVENTDLLPHIRDLEIPDFLEGTVLDGEMMIENRPFKDVSSTMNCKWDKAIKRQLELGFITFKAFDIIRLGGVNVQNMPLERRKHYLSETVGDLAFDYIKDVEYSDSGMYLSVNEYEESLDKLKNSTDLQEKFPILYEEMKPQFLALDPVGTFFLGKRAYYELIVLSQGEGIILKNLKGRYFNKRTKEYIKIKKFDTWDVIVIGFSEPKKEYSGKTSLDKWTYWYNPEEDISWEGEKYNEEDIPVTKYYAKGWIGAIKYGVIVSDEELKEIQKKAPKEKFEVHPRLDVDLETGYRGNQKILYVGECSGMTEEVRNEISENPNSYLDKVMEIKGQEVIKKTGKIRHTRFLRFREDKNAEDCIWKDHIRD